MRILASALSMIYPEMLSDSAIAWAGSIDNHAVKGYLPFDGAITAAKIPCLVAGNYPSPRQWLPWRIASQRFARTFHG
jgi:hypothetical protein